MKVRIYEVMVWYNVKTWENDELRPRKSASDYELLEHTLPLIKRTILQERDSDCKIYFSRDKAIKYANDWLAEHTTRWGKRNAIKTDTGNFEFDFKGVSLGTKVFKKFVNVPEENINE